MTKKKSVKKAAPKPATVAVMNVSRKTIFTDKGPLLPGESHECDADVAQALIDRGMVEQLGSSD